MTKRLQYKVIGETFYVFDSQNPDVNLAEFDTASSAVESIRLVERLWPLLVEPACAELDRAQNETERILVQFPLYADMKRDALAAIKRARKSLQAFNKKERES